MTPDADKLVDTLPHRLRELRQEMGWSLDDVAQIVGVTQRGVVSNWEAMNQRRRTPSLGTLVLLQRWYGVSLDYLIGNPAAERDSPEVKVGRRDLHRRLRGCGSLGLLSPSDRARFVVQEAMQIAPIAWFEGRIRAVLLVGAQDYQALMEDLLWPDPLLERLANLFGLNMEWFYSPNPCEALNHTQ